jgi:hypothetical protein
MKSRKPLQKDKIRSTIRLVGGLDP